MTQEEKAKAYDEALEKAKAHINSKGIGDTVDLCKHLFSELRESEDERIRKYLIDFVGLSDNPRKGEILAYLEKQKEQDKEEPKIAFGNWGDKEKQEAVITLIKYARWIKKITNEECKDLVQWFENNIVFNVLEKDGWTIACEQTDTIKEDYYGAFLRGEMRGYMRAKREEQKCPKFCNGHCVVCEQKEQKPAWSEEDETHLGWIIECFVSWKYQVPEFADQYKSAINWLKSLRPQPKKGLHPDSIRKVDNPMKWMEEDEKEREQRSVTWSDEDEKRVKEAIKRIDELEFLGIHCNNVRKVLESIRPSWKPSEEQMEALRNAAAVVAGNKSLIDLYEQLKKL